MQNIQSADGNVKFLIKKENRRTLAWDDSTFKESFVGLCGGMVGISKEHSIKNNNNNKNKTKQNKQTNKQTKNLVSPYRVS